MNIEELVLGIRKVAEQMGSAVIGANALSGEARSKVAECDKVLARLNAVSIEVNKRSEAIKEIEDVVKLKAEADALMKEVASATDKLEQNRLAFEARRKSELTAIANAKAKNSNDSEMLAKEWSIYNKREVDLTARENNYKERVALSIVAGVK